VEVGEKVIVVGGGLMGVEAALALVQQNKKVTILEMLGPEAVLKNVPYINGLYLKMWLNEQKERMITNTKMEAITHLGIRAIDKSFNWKDFPADTIVLATGMEARKEKVDELRRLIPETEVSIIGDCFQPRNLASAIHDGFNCAVDI
jgi:NADH dehydrogenase FAD-containing subunit